LTFRTGDCRISITRKRRPSRTRIMGKGEVDGVVVAYPEVDATLMVEDSSMMDHIKPILCMNKRHTMRHSR
jgi:hypothetical protein